MWKEQLLHHFGTGPPMGVSEDDWTLMCTLADGLDTMRRPVQRGSYKLLAKAFEERAERVRYLEHTTQLLLGLLAQDPEVQHIVNGQAAHTRDLSVWLANFIYKQSLLAQDHTKDHLQWENTINLTALS